jgi:predicted dehydrogenase
MKFLIAGSGSIGRRHIRNLLALGEKDILLYRTHQGTLADEEISQFPFETDLQAALGQHPDAVIVSNPTSKHLDVAIPAAAAGCHLLIEKPVSGSLDGLDLLEEKVSSMACKTLVGFQFRFHPVLRQIKEFLSEGSLGRVLSAQAHWGEYLPGWHPWEDYRGGYAARNDLGGGVVLTLCHPTDYLRWLIGEIDMVSAKVGKISDLEIAVEDNAEITLGFENGCVGHVHLDYYQQPADHWLEITTTQGHIRWNNASGVAEIFHTEHGWSRLEPPSGFERNDLFLSEMRHFIEVIKGNEASLCDLSDGKKSLEIVLAVYRSSMEDSRSVAI